MLRRSLQSLASVGLRCAQVQRTGCVAALPKLHSQFSSPGFDESRFQQQRFAVGGGFAFRGGAAPLATPRVKLPEAPYLELQFVPRLRPPSSALRATPSRAAAYPASKRFFGFFSTGLPLLRGCAFEEEGEGGGQACFAR
jgi:hypothetical protein